MINIRCVCVCKICLRKRKKHFPIILRQILIRAAGNAVGYFVVTKVSVLGFSRLSIHLKTSVMAYGLDWCMKEVPVLSTSTALNLVMAQGKQTLDSVIIDRTLVWPCMPKITHKSSAYFLKEGKIGNAIGGQCGTKLRADPH